MIARVEYGKVLSVFDDEHKPADEQVLLANDGDPKILSFVPVPSGIADQVAPGWRYDGKAFKAGFDRRPSDPSESKDSKD